MKNRKILALSISLLMMGSGFFSVRAQEQLPDLSGTWVGNTETPNGTDTLTLTLTKKGEVYSGFISDSLGMLVEAPLQGIKYEKGVMTFFFMVATGDGEMRVNNSLKLDSGKIAGEWTIGTDMAGSFILERKK